ncbi:MAG: hypothetical protein ACREDG_08085, partial [Methylocella sp.]
MDGKVEYKENQSLAFSQGAQIAIGKSGISIFGVTFNAENKFSVGAGNTFAFAKASDFKGARILGIAGGEVIFNTGRNQVEVKIGDSGAVELRLEKDLQLTPVAGTAFRGHALYQNGPSQIELVTEWGTKTDAPLADQLAGMEVKKATIFGVFNGEKVATEIPAEFITLSSKDGALTFDAKAFEAKFVARLETKSLPEEGKPAAQGPKAEAAAAAPQKTEVTVLEVIDVDSADAGKALLRGTVEIKAGQLSTMFEGAKISNESGKNVAIKIDEKTETLAKGEMIYVLANGSVNIIGAKKVITIGPGGEIVDAATASGQLNKIGATGAFTYGFLWWGEKFGLNTVDQKSAWTASEDHAKS